MKKNIKTLFKLTALSTSLLGIMSSFAATPTPPTSNPIQAMVAQLQAIDNNVQVVGNQMQSIAEANVKAQYPSLPNPSISQSAVVNPALLDIMGTNNATLIPTMTTNDVTSQLQPVSDNLLEVGNGMNNANAVSQRLINDANLKMNLSTLLPASDTIYSNDPSVLNYINSNGSNFSGLPSWGLKQPTTLYDNYFSFSSLMQPLTYSDNGTAAKAFLAFLAQSYNNPATPIDYNAFQQKLAQAQGPSDKASLYVQLLNDSNYINYQLSTRSTLAARSVAVNNFQNLITERTPVTGLGTTAGLVNSNGTPVPNASPLQVESYLATRRANNPTWYTQVQTESPASVQRETLVVLAEIEAQNFQAHLDSERLLATLSAQVATSSSTATQLNTAQASQVNNDIQNFTLPSQQNNSSNPQTPPTPGTNP